MREAQEIQLKPTCEATNIAEMEEHITELQRERPISYGFSFNDII